MGSAFIQTTLFWVFTLDYWLKLDHLPKPNNHNYLINSYSMPISQTFDLKKDSIFFGSWSQNRFSDCFMIQHLKEKQFKRQIKLDFSVCFVIQNWEKNCFWCFSFFLNIGLQNAHLNSFFIESFILHEWKEES